MFSDEVKAELSNILKASGYQGKFRGKYCFIGGKNLQSVDSVIKHIGFPACASGIDILAPVSLSVFTKTIDYASWEDVLVELTPKTTKTSVHLPDILKDEETKDVLEYVSNLTPVVNLQEGAKRKIILLDFTEGRNGIPVMDVDEGVYTKVTGLDYDALLHDENTAKGFLGFNPYVLSPVYKDKMKSKVREIIYVNLYTPPRWRFVDAPAKYHGRIKQLMEHLFPVESDREYVLDWLHYAIVGRNETVLGLIGARGTGKGILFESVLSNLVGKEYREVVGQDILQEKFNSPFKNKRFIFMDEVTITDEKELAKIRAFANRFIAFQSKGADAMTIENFSSMGVTSNDLKSFMVEPQERRFSLPEVTSVPLLDIMTEDEVTEFVQELDNEESVVLAEFGNYLLERKPKTPPTKPLKGEYFFKLSRMSMSEWKSFLLDYIMKFGRPQQPIYLSELQKRFKKVFGDKSLFPKKRGTIEAFLNDYLHEGLFRIGEIVDAEDLTDVTEPFAIMPATLFLEKFGVVQDRASELVDESEPVQQIVIPDEVEEYDAL